MKKLLLAVAAVVVLAVLVIVGIFAASELGGEVVTLQTLAADGTAIETRLWIVEVDGDLWLRAGARPSGWLKRIEADPRVSITRGEVTSDHRAVPVRDAQTRDRIHAAMRERYPLADALVSLARDGSLSVPVRLEPMPDGG